VSLIMILGRASLVACLTLTQLLAGAQTEAPSAVSENASAESAAAPHFPSPEQAKADAMPGSPAEGQRANGAPRTWWRRVSSVK
jgi:hypothetical protein